MSPAARDAALLIGLAVLAVAATEVVIRLGLAAVERATSILFILLLLNLALVQALRRQRPPG